VEHGDWTRARARQGNGSGRVVLTATAMLTALIVGAGPVRAQEAGAPVHLAQLSAERRFDIPVQPLTTALGSGLN